MSIRAWVPALVLAGLALPFSGCGFGTAAVAAAVGGGGGAADGPPELAVEQATFQPEDGSTLIAVKLAQASARTARLSFEYDLGPGRVRIPASSLQRYEPTTRTALADLPLDASSRFLAPTSKAGTTYFFLWKHSVDLGQIEQRAVTLWALLADAERAEPDDSARQIFAQQTVGRQAPEIESFELIRASGDPEAPLTARVTLLDRGADRGVWQYQLRHALTSATPAASDFVALGGNPIAPTLDSENISADGRVRSQLSFPVDVLNAGIPLGRHPGLWLSLGVTEVYPVFRSDIPASTKSVSGLASLAVSPPSELQIGYAPLIDLASVVDPGSSSNGGDPGRPWLRLPIAARVFNPSNRVTLRVRISGRYSVGGDFLTSGQAGADDSIKRPMTPFVTGDPESEFEFDLAPREQSQRFLVWNVVRDEGLGNRVVSPSAPSAAEPRREANIDLFAEAVGAKNGSVDLPIAGGALGSSYPGLISTLSTDPFVRFRETLLSNVQRMWSSGRDVAGQTRDIFFSADSGGNERLLGIDQQFEPVQITPTPAPFDFNAGNNIAEALATDFDPTNPDCIAWVGSQYRYLTWPSIGGPPSAITVGSAGGSLTFPTNERRGAQTAGFTLPSAAGENYVGLFYVWKEQVVAGAKSLQVQLIAVVRNPIQGTVPTQANFYVRQSAVLTRDLPNLPTGGVPNGSPHMVVGEFDGDPTSKEVVIGNLGAEYTVVGRPGLLDMWTVRIGASGLEFSEAPTLPRPQIPAGGPSHPIERWSLHRWRQDASSRDALALVRCMGPTNRSVDFKLLTLSPTGGFESSWSTANEGLTASSYPDLANVQLRRVFTEDLDGSAGGVEGSDLVLTFGRQGPGGPNDQRMDVFLLARRANREARWRRLFNQVQMQPPPGGASGPGRILLDEAELVDVNGDRFLDLVTREDYGSSSQKHFNYFASTLAGVAGKMGALAASAGDPTLRSQLPGVFDFNKDGRSDILSGGRVHGALANGSYQPLLAGLPGSNNSEYRIERVFLDAPQDSIEFLVADRTESAQNRVDRVTGIGGTLSSALLISYGLGGAVREVRALTAPDTVSRRRKDLVGLVEAASQVAVRRGRIEGASVVHSAMWSGTASPLAGMALVRREPMVPGLDPALDSAIQDVVVVDAANPNQLVVLDAFGNYAARFVTLPPGQVAVRLAEGAVSDDGLEDLLVLTQQDGVFRVLCLVQNPIPSQGVAQPALVKTLLQFASPFPGGAVAMPRAFQFSRRRDSLADGFLLLENPNAPNSSEARFIKPIGQGSSLAARLVRSPLRDSIGAELRVVVDDRDQDDILEVIGGEQATTNGLRRLQTNIQQF